jgi:hypothetical protein
LYWPYIVDVSATGIANPLAKYYMYYSTDHADSYGYTPAIWMATSDSPYGPWTGRGQIYRDTVTGDHTETACVIWNDDEGLFFMYYRQGGNPAGVHGQGATYLATSPNGYTDWTRVGLMVNCQTSNSFPGDSYSGYFRPFRIGRQWYGYHLSGGGGTPHFGLSYSGDGRTWMMDPKPLVYGADQFSDGRRIEWNSGDPVWWRGKLYWIGMCSNFTAGSTPKDARLAIAPLSGNLRNLMGKPKYQLYPTIGTNENTDYRSLFSMVVDGKLIVYYQCGNNFNIATAG